MHVRGTGAALAAISMIAALATVVSAKPFADRTPEGLPNVQSDAACVVDADTGELVYARNPDEVRAIASTGKIFVAMVVRKKGLDLEATTVMSKVDAEYARGGARTRLPTGHTFRNVDLLRAMLIASDNRAPTALGRAVGLDPEELVAEMNILARSLGLEKTRFTDPSGLNGNVSTAREMAKALAAAMADPLLAEIMGTEVATVRSVANRPRVIHYRNTNKPLHSERYTVSGGKTGFTDEAGYCLLIEAEIGGRRLVMSFLGANEKLTRFGDFGRVTSWIADRARDVSGGGTAVADVEP